MPGHCKARWPVFSHHILPPALHQVSIYSKVARRSRKECTWNQELPLPLFSKDVTPFCQNWVLCIDSVFQSTLYHFAPLFKFHGIKSRSKNEEELWYCLVGIRKFDASFY